MQVSVFKDAFVKGNTARMLRCVSVKLHRAKEAAVSYSNGSQEHCLAEHAAHAARTDISNIPKYSRMAPPTFGPLSVRLSEWHLEYSGSLPPPLGSQHACLWHE